MLWISCCCHNNNSQQQQQQDGDQNPTLSHDFAQEKKQKTFKKKFFLFK
jgi:hypothetical protein